MTQEPEPVPLVVLGDPAAALVCEGDVCYLPPLAEDPPPGHEVEDPEHPQ